VIFRFTDSLGNEWAVHRHTRQPQVIAVECARKCDPERPIYLAIPPEDVPRLVSSLSRLASNEGGAV
jgi:hypothetical protein